MYKVQLKSGRIPSVMGQKRSWQGHRLYCRRDGSLGRGLSRGRPGSVLSELITLLLYQEYAARSHEQRQGGLSGGLQPSRQAMRATCVRGDLWTWSESRHSLKAEPAGYPVRLDGECVGKAMSRIPLGRVCLNNWSLWKNGQGCEWSSCVGRRSGSHFGHHTYDISLMS